MTKRQRLGLSTLLCLKLIIGVLGAGVRPMWIGHESDYFSVVRFLVENRRLPERSDFEGAERSADIAQATQPPLFTFVALPIVALFDDNSTVPPGINPGIVCEGGNSLSYPYMLTTAYNMPPDGAAAAGYALRLMNLMFSIGMMYIVYRIVREIETNSHSTALIATAFAGFQPHLFDLGISISNESLLLLISSANLFFAVRLVRTSELRFTYLVALIATGLMGPLTKTNGYVLLILTGVVLIYLILYHLITHPRSRVPCMLVFSAWVLLAGLIAISIFNYVQYGSVIGRYQRLFAITIDHLDELNTTKLTATLRDTYFDYIKMLPFGREKLIWLYLAGTLTSLILFIGRLRRTMLRRDRQQLITEIVLLGYLMVAIALVLLRGNLVNTLIADKVYAPVRYYISGLPALAVMMALGWQTLIPVRLPNALAVRLTKQRARFYSRWLAWNWPGLLWALVWFSIVLWNVAQDVRVYPAFYTLSPNDLEALIAHQDVTPVTAVSEPPPDVPQLRAYSYTIGDDGILHLTTYIQVEETPALNYIARVVLSDNEGVSSTCEIIPHSGRFTVTSWNSGQIVTVPMDIPNCAESGQQLSNPITVTLDWLPANPAGEFVVPQVNAAQIISVYADVPRAQSCPSNLGVFDGTFQVVKYTAPTSATAGSVYLPAVNWYVRTDIDNDNLSRFYIITHKESTQSYSCIGTPRLGDHPIDRWKRGETIYFDQCWLEIPPDAPSGEYTVAVGMVDNLTGDYLPITSSQGNVSPQGLLNVATLVVK